MSDKLIITDREKIMLRALILMRQAEMLADDLGIDKKDMKKLAKERYEECKQEFKTSGKSQYFI